MEPSKAALMRAIADLSAINARWALIGGFAVGCRTAPRPTEDVDFAALVADDPEAEAMVMRLGYQHAEFFEDDDTGRLSTVRLWSPVLPPGGVKVDLLFTSSGIEGEIVSAAGRLEVLPGIFAPVATRAHLLAMKILANRGKDQADIRSLIAASSESDLNEAQAAAELIRDRGLGRADSVPQDLKDAVLRFRARGR